MQKKLALNFLARQLGRGRGFHTRPAVASSRNYVKGMEYLTDGITVNTVDDGQM